MLLTEMKEAVLASLGDEAGALVTDEYLTQSVHQAVQDISRILPQEKVLELQVDYEIADETFTSDHDTAVSLANTFIEHDSETVNSAAAKAGTTYTRDTDYTINYTTGQITVLSTGSMADSTTYYITYDASRISLDISSLTNLMKVVMVEYPIGKVPQHIVPFARWGNRLYILGTVSEPRSQVDLILDEHLLIYYHAYHTAPTAATRGTFIPHLDQVAVLGASGYCAASLVLHMMRTAYNSVGLCAALIALAAAAGGTGELLEASDALDNVATIIAAIEAGGGALADLDTALSAISSPISSATSLLGSIGSDITAAAAVESSQDGRISAAVSNLAAGAALINTVNKGANVPENYRGNAEVDSELAQHYTARRQAYIAAAQTRAVGAEQYISIAQSHLTAAQVRLGEVSARTALANAYISEANQRNATASGLIASAQQHSLSAERYMQMAERYQLEASRRLSEFFRVLNDRAQMARETSLISVRQPY